MTSKLSMNNLSKRHLAKTITWRVIGSTDTVILSLFISGDLSLAIKIGGFELVTKMLLYYFHEIFWFNSNYRVSNRRHLFKTFSWRAIGTLDTVILSWIVTGNPLMGLKIGSLEVISKMVLYFLHEKIWYKINYGLDQRNKKKQDKLSK